MTQQPPQSNRQIDSGRDYVEQVRGDVYSGDVHIHQAPQPVPERPTIFHNLPQPDYGQFVGREAELTTLMEILRPYPYSQNAVVTIDGIGGIGKSALALEVAHHYLRQFDELPEEERFEAIIWMSAKQTVLTGEGISSRPQILHTLNDIDTTIAMTLQREDIMQSDAENQHKRVCSALTQQRTLLFVDNFETIDDEAIGGFLRQLPAPTKAIVTTRHRIDVSYPVRLSGMPWQDGRDLIVQECQEKEVTLAEEMIRQLYERTGGVPLALVWSVAQMGYGYAPQSVLKRLGQPSNDITKFCFEGAVQRIKHTPSYKLLLTLSLCADSASREALGYATELPELDRDDGLVLLEKLSLINKKGERFRLLPLTKGYAAAEFETYPKHEHLREKWNRYFCVYSEKCRGGGYWNWTDYAWLLAEGENLLAIVHWATKANQGELALSFVQAMQRYLNIQGRRYDLEQYGEQLATLAQALNDKTSWAWLCVNWLFWLYGSQEKFDEAEKYIHRGVALYEELGDIKGLCFALVYLGRFFRVTERENDAENTIEQARVLAHNHNYGDGVAAVDFESGKITRERGESAYSSKHEEIASTHWEASKTHWENVLHWYEQDDAHLDPQSYMAAVGNLGLIEFYLGNYQKGRELLERSLGFIQQFGGKGHGAILHLRLAKVEHALSNPSKALQHLQTTLFWVKRLNMERELREAQTLLQELNAEAAETQQQEQTP